MRAKRVLTPRNGKRNVYFHCNVIFTSLLNRKSTTFFGSPEKNSPRFPHFHLHILGEFFIIFQFFPFELFQNFPFFPFRSLHFLYSPSRLGFVKLLALSILSHGAFATIGKTLEIGKVLKLIVQN